LLLDVSNRFSAKLLLGKKSTIFFGFSNPRRRKKMFGLGAHEVLIFLVIATVLFGSSKIPQLMRNIGKGANEFKKGMRETDDEPIASSVKDSATKKDSVE